LCKLQNAKERAEHDTNGSQRFTIERISALTNLDSHTVCKIFNCIIRVDRKSLAQCFQAFDLLLKPDDYGLFLPQPFGKLEQAPENRKETAPDRQATGKSLDCSAIGAASKPRTQLQNCRVNGLTPDVSIFYGHIAELATLTHWIRVDRCRLVALTGQGGSGKTFLAAKLVEQIQADFDYVIWQSLHHPPSINEYLTQVIHSVTGAREAESVEADVTTPCNRLTARAIDLLRSCRCLLILDNFETILQGCDPKQGGFNQLAGYYRPEFEGYHLFLKHSAETAHQSCVVLASRELPRNIRQQVGHGLPIRSLLVKG
jgi:hypothetical protein